MCAALAATRKLRHMRKNFINMFEGNRGVVKYLKFYCETALQLNRLNLLPLQGECQRLWYFGEIRHHRARFAGRVVLPHWYKENMLIVEQHADIFRRIAQSVVRGYCQQ